MSTLIISGAFALRQQRGIPVFTEIKTNEESYSESEINAIISSCKVEFSKSLCVA